MRNEITAAGSLIQIISQSRQNALKKVNEELINMQWRVGEYLSKESAKASFGDAYIDSIAEKENCYKMMLLTGSKKPETLRFYEKAGYNSSDKTAFIQ